ncbi:uncharacterized protein LY89DRAFT_740767 [Mollisia scopiformis]|uniref:Uncharacterized protein n=1 Tax=Mollisia scopiformis TaxID=149040 RepID=A0A132BBC8_MOLSC|nr:uncharacterized protein LY89DRAFT_740767 [Mollisia scopiformis]KUJ09691.1 hypothetical protein LY89DRAFT_740767 [Mollisia scopiformis]
MRASIPLSLAFLSTVLAQNSITAAPSVVTVTSAAITTPVAGPQAYIGASTEPALGAYTSWFCPPGQAWVQVGNYARCCDSNQYEECGIATACLSTSLMVGPSSQQIWTCSGTGTQTLCVTGTVYASIGATVGVTNCWNGGNWVATRDISITTSSSSSSSSSTTPISSTPTTLHETSIPSSSSSTPPSTSKGPHAGAIAGIVFGILILVALVAISLFVYRRRRKAKRTPEAAPDPYVPTAFMSELPAQERDVGEASRFGVQRGRNEDEDEVSVVSGASGEAGGVLL